VSTDNVKTFEALLTMRLWAKEVSLIEISNKTSILKLKFQGAFVGAYIFQDAYYFALFVATHQ